MQALRDAEIDIRTRQIALAEALRLTNMAIEDGRDPEPRRLEVLLDKVSVPATLRLFYRVHWIVVFCIGIAFSCGAIAGSFELISHTLHLLAQLRPPTAIAPVVGYLPPLGLFLLGIATVAYALKGSRLRHKR